ncbi:uncharacterized protein zbbx, partial [Fundulus diaphanus]
MSQLWTVACIVLLILQQYRPHCERPSAATDWRSTAKDLDEILLPLEIKGMDLNDFVVPNNKTRSVKLNARNLQKLQLDTTALASESKEMEEKLEQLKENMSKEKEERG